MVTVCEQIGRVRLIPWKGRLAGVERIDLNVVLAASCHGPSLICVRGAVGRCRRRASMVRARCGE